VELPEVKCNQLLLELLSLLLVSDPMVVVVAVVVVVGVRLLCKRTLALLAAVVW
jgi:hypothetical protein